MIKHIQIICRQFADHFVGLARKVFQFLYKCVKLFSMFLFVLFLSSVFTIIQILL